VPHSVLREFLKKRKDPARTTKQAKNLPAPHSVLRVAQKRKVCGAHRRAYQELLRAALRLARVAQTPDGAVIRGLGWAPTAERRLTKCGQPVRGSA